MTVILDDGERLVAGLPVDPATADRVVRIRGWVDLNGYAHPLPSLTTIGWDVGLRDYAHALPSLTEIRGDAYLGGYAHALPSLTTIGGTAYLGGYAHPLPSLTTIGGDVGLRGYAHALPSLTEIRGDAYLGGYAHPLPSLTTIGGRAFLRRYAHIPAWIGYVGDDSRDYSFWADLLRHRVRAGCRNFSPEQARAHWGPGGESDRPDCLALAEKAIALIKRSGEKRS